jgi:hypothetical protein
MFNPIVIDKKGLSVYEINLDIDFFSSKTILHLAKNALFL